MSLLQEIGFIEIKNTNELEEITYRYLDFVSYKDGAQILEPYFYLYNYGQVDRTLDYSAPLEGLNYKEVLDHTNNIVQSASMYINDTLKYVNTIYAPQLYPTTVGESPTVNGMFTGSEVVIGKETSSNLYILLEKGDVELKIFRKHRTFEDPYLQDPANVHLRREILLTPLKLENEDLEIRTVVVNLSTDFAEINYSSILFGNQIKTPVKWVTNNNVIRDASSLPSINTLKDLQQNNLKVDQDKNLLINSQTVGCLSLLSSELKEAYLEDSVVDIDSVLGELLINGNKMENGRYFET